MKFLSEIVDISEAKKPAKKPSKKAKSKAKSKGTTAKAKPKFTFSRPPIKVTNKEHGFFGHTTGTPAEKKAKFEALHRKVGDLVKEKNHRMVGHFLDSEHGRHLAKHQTTAWGAQDKATVEKHIKARWNTFKKEYQPELFNYKHKK